MSILAFKTIINAQKNPVNIYISSQTVLSKNNYSTIEQ